MRALIALGALALFLACSGNGDGGNIPRSLEPATNLEGIWIGSKTSSAGTTVPITALVLANGTMRTFDDGGIQGVGTLVGGATGFTVTGDLYAPVTPPFGSAQPTTKFTLKGTGVSQASLSGTYTSSGDSGSFSFQYDAYANYFTPVVLANVGGTYQALAAQTSTGLPTSLQIMSTGAFTGSDTVGGTNSISGSLAPVDPAKNAFQVVKLTYSVAGGPQQTFTGLAFFEFSGTTKLWIMTTAGNAQFAGYFTQINP